MQDFIYKAEVERVIDGDTIDFKLDLGFGIHIKERVRLAGIDTPETRTRDLVEKQAGNLATDVVKQKLSEYEYCYVRTEFDRTGKFGRTLGVVYLINDDSPVLTLNQYLLDNNLAVQYNEDQSPGDRDKLHSLNLQILVEKGLISLKDS